jgi:hypothetical protein
MHAISSRFVTIVAVFAFIAGAAALSFAQALAQRPVTPMVLSGADIGFRMEGRRGNTPTGKFVVRVGGEWVPVEFSGGVMPAGSN